MSPIRLNEEVGSDLLLDVETLQVWPGSMTFLNNLITQYEREAVHTESTVDSEGQVQFSVPDEAAISTRGYALAEATETYASSTESALNLIYASREKSDSRLAASLRGSAQDIRDSIGPNPDPISEVLVTGSSSREVSSKDLIDRIPGIDVVKKNELIKWFSDCYRCETRISATLNNDLTLPEILLDMADLIAELDSIMDTALAAFDWTKFLAQICPLLSLGTWCIPDLIAFLTILASLLQQYWLVDPLLEFDWWGLVATLLYPVLQGIYVLVSTGLNLSIAPMTCINNMIDDIRGVFEATSTLDASLGLSIGHLTATILTAHPATPSAYSADVVRRLSGKTDWVSGDTLIDYSEIINFLNPAEVAKLALTDFDFKLNNLSEWLSSRLAVLKVQSRNTLLSSLKFTNVMLAVGRLYSFIKTMIELISEGKSICTEETSSTGATQFVPTETLQNLFAGTGFIPSWVTFDNTPGPSGPETGSIFDGENQNRPESFTIIDSSTGATSTIIGCLGRLSQGEAVKIQEWMDELDDLTS